MSRRSRLQNAGWPVLFPLACAWAGAATLRRRWWSRRARYRSSLPVICVGNVHSGGSGKTPLVIAIASRFAEQRPVVLSRGYRASGGEQPRRVDPADPRGVERFGDEPWMISRRLSCPVYVGADRRRALEKIEHEKAGSFVLLDDGFQHLRVAPTVSLVAIGTDRPPHESYCLPLGELREPLSALRQASAVVLVSGNASDHGADWRSYLDGAFPGLPVFNARRRWESPSGEGIGRLGAFCGIAGPERFFTDLTAHVAPVVYRRAFPDHHDYRDADLRGLVDEGARQGVTHWATTEKDLVKVEERFRALGQSLVAARIQYELPEEFWYFLRSFLERR